MGGVIRHVGEAVKEGKHPGREETGSLQVEPSRRLAAARPVFRQEGQAEEEDRGANRQGDEKHPAPGKVVGDKPTDVWSDDAAELKARNDEADGCLAAALLEDIANHAGDGGEEHAATGCLDYPKGDQYVDVRREPASSRPKREHHD